MVTSLFWVVVALKKDMCRRNNNQICFVVFVGGDEIREDCRKYRYGLSDGDVVVTSPGKLPCAVLIHAIGPYWKGGSYGEAKSLAECVRKSMFEVSSRKLQSIAFPAIGSGCRCYPIDEATSIILYTIYSYLDEDMSTSLNDVYLVDMDVEAMRCFENKLSQIKGISKVDHQGHGMSLFVLYFCIRSIREDDSKM